MTANISLISSVAKGAACAVILGAQGCGGASDPFSFDAENIATNVEGAYLTAVADLNGDSRPDVILLSIRSREVAWYENPTWERHVLAVGITLAAVGAAVEGSAAKGDLKIVLLTGFHRDKYQENKGELVFLTSAEEGSPTSVFAREPAAHRAAFADVNGDGARELVLAPISGPGEDPPISSLADGPLILLSPPEADRHIVTQSLKGTVHGLAIIDWDADGRDDVLTAGLDGVWLHRSKDSERGASLDALTWRSAQLTRGRPSDDPRQRGSGDIRVGRFADGVRFLATIDSVHGSDIAVYRETSPGVWSRRVIDDHFEAAHGFALADFNGDGADEIIVSDSRGEGGVFLYYTPDKNGRDWRRVAIDGNAMTGGACDAVDMTGDGLIDLVCAGFETKNAKLYVNSGERR